MTNQELEEFLYNEIPMARAIGMKVLEASSSRSKIVGPLSLNRNHMDTAFGGSLSTLLILSCYTWLFQKLDLMKFKSHVLIQSGHTEYLLPVKEDIVAIANAPDEKDFQRFFETFSRKSVGKISIEATVNTAQGTACTFKGEFVAQKIS